MTIRLIQEGLEDLCPMQGRTSTYPHVSTIIHQICLDRGYYVEEEDTEVAAQARLTRMQLGSTLEWAVKDRYRHHYGNRFQDIGETIHGGLALTPDFVDTETKLIHHPIAVDDVKFTYMSSNADPAGEKFEKYWMQVGAYCEALDTNIGRIRVCHPNGNYRDFRGPVFRVWEREFSRRERAENWALIKSYQRSMGL